MDKIELKVWVVRCVHSLRILQSHTTMLKNSRHSNPGSLVVKPMRPPNEIQSRSMPDKLPVNC